MESNLIIGMVGAGGDGVVSAGEALMTAAAADGYHALLTKSFGSQIRGGESSCRVRLSTDEIYSSSGTLDLLIVLSWDDFLKFGAELPVGGHTSIIYDSKGALAADTLHLTSITPAELLAIPITALAKQAAGTDKAKNSLVLGLLAAWLGIGRDSIITNLRKRFAKKDPELVAGNERAFAAGLAYANENALRCDRRMAAAAKDGTKRLVIDGNSMCAAAAIFAGCEFFGGYPITPSTEIMQFLDRELWKYGGTVLQAEDEMAGVGAAIGASFGGKKSMTATSGPGMSLKTELLGLATIAEIPLVCINVQRGGPSTGLPTKSEQADLFQAVFSGHGDCVRPILAPISVSDTFGLTVEAFNIAEAYQTPVILLSDQEIAQRKETVTAIDTGSMRLLERRQPSASELAHYERFRLTESGISPISRPGMSGGSYLASGIEHNECGAPSASGEVHAHMTAKRLKKLDTLKQRRDLFLCEGDPDAPLGVSAWGSIAGAAREALRRAHAKGLRVKLLVPKLLYPVAEAVYEEFFSSVRGGLVVEQSYQGQLHRIIRMYVNVPAGVRSFAKSGANPIVATEIVDQLQGLALDLQRRRVPDLQPVE